MSSWCGACEKALPVPIAPWSNCGGVGRDASVACMRNTGGAAILRILQLLVCVIALLHLDVLAVAAEPTAEAKVPPDQLDALVAPIALYPDPMLAQTLAASTYPLEIVQLQQWLQKNPGLKDKALADAV